MPVEQDPGIAVATNHVERLRDLGEIFVEVLGEIRVLVACRKRAAVLPQIQREEVAAPARRLRKCVLEEVGQFDLEEIVRPPV